MKGCNELIFAPELAGPNVYVVLPSFKSETNSAGGWLGSPVGSVRHVVPTMNASFLSLPNLCFMPLICASSGRLAVISAP